MAAHPYYRIAMGLKPIAMKEAGVNFKGDFALDANHHKPHKLLSYIIPLCFYNITFEKHHPHCRRYPSHFYGKGGSIGLSLRLPPVNKT